MSTTTTDPVTSGAKYDYLVLASASPRRSYLLQELGVRFTVCPANVEEHEEPDSCPRETVLHNARIKAEQVARLQPDSLVLGSDTTVALDNEVLHKPPTLEDAFAMLAKLSGRIHTVYTGVCLRSLNGGVDEAHFVTSEVTFRPLSREDMERYFEIVNPLDKAGAYGIQEGRELIIESLNGSLNNVMGLPTEFLRERLEQLGLWSQLEVSR
ncbi:Maf family protein [Cerasicoccus frondis]|uniref:Maf family protein n=1 Tax=Cerasicoccus frondis TaxID=490090 RepID=UPI00285274B8|nr:Maf family protein [Cerasicoccus frondis]